VRLAILTTCASRPHNVQVTARRPGWALVFAGWLAWLATPAIGALAGHPAEALRSTAQVVAYLLTGTVVFAMRPGNPVARRLLAFAVLLAAGYAVGAGYSAYRVQEGTPAWGWLVILLIQDIDFASSVVIFMVCALFPDGKYQRSYERRMAAILAVAVPLLLLMQLAGSARLKYGSSFVWQASVSARNPVAVPALAGLGAVAAVAIQAGVAVLLLGVVVLIARYRRFGPAERQQIAWPLYGLALTGCASVLLGVAASAVNTLPAWAQYLLYLPVVLFIPAGLVIGVVRHRLLDIRLVVRRSAVYGTLWLLIALAYAGVAAAFGVVAGRRVPLAVAILLTIVVTMVAAPRTRLTSTSFGMRCPRRITSRFGTREVSCTGLS